KAAAVWAVTVTFAEPEILRVVASAATKLAIVDDEPVEFRLMVVKPSSAAASVSVMAPVVVRPLTFKASGLAVGGAVRRPRAMPKLVPVPERVTVVKALESMVAAAKLDSVTDVIEPAAVAEAALASVTVTAPFATPILPAVSLVLTATAADWLTETEVVVDL